MNRLIMKKSEQIISDRKVISILSGKGGVGKSLFTFNLAERLSALGKRVLIVDADLNFGNQHILLNQSANCGLIDLLNDNSRDFRDHLLSVNAFCDLLPAVGSDEMHPVDSLSGVLSLFKVINDQKEIYDFILLDHASGLSDFAVASAFSSDLNLLVLVPELTSISDCYGLFKHLKSQEASLDCRIVINRAENSDDAEKIYSRFCSLTEQFMGQFPKYLGFISESRELKRALASQKPLAFNSPKAVVLKQFEGIARKLIATLQSGSYPFESEENNIKQEINKTPAYADIKE